jgi:predicted anti-sigma-YlaC factor YlaD
MSKKCAREFDERLLSGYLDQELTQADEQRVRLHLEECEECSATVEEMTRIREATMTTSFVAADDNEWQEAPRSALSSWLRRIGWLLTGGWLLAMGFFAIAEYLRAPESWYVKAIPVVLVVGVALLLASIVLDRIKAAKSDRYRGVKK